MLVVVVVMVGRGTSVFKMSVHHMGNYFSEDSQV